jgi:hypothetical protein
MLNDTPHDFIQVKCRQLYDSDSNKESVSNTCRKVISLKFSSVHESGAVQVNYGNRIVQRRVGTVDVTF